MATARGGATTVPFPCSKKTQQKGGVSAPPFAALRALRRRASVKQYLNRAMRGCEPHTTSFAGYAAFRNLRATTASPIMRISSLARSTKTISAARLVSRSAETGMSPMKSAMAINPV